MKSLLLSSAFICVHLWFHSVAFGEPPEPKFRHQTIDDKIQIGYGVAAADVDGDKKIDILLADKRQFVWYRNPTWEKFVIAEELTKRDNVCLAAQDIDGDGKCELAVGGDWDPNDRETSGAVFYMIAPEDRTKKWEAVRLPAEPTVHRMRWVNLDEGGWGLVVAPLYGRGKEGDAPSKILLYHKPDNVRDAWQTEMLDESMHKTHNFDTREDGSVMIAGREGATAVGRMLRDRKIHVTRKRVDFAQGVGEIRWSGGFTATVEPMHGNEAVVYDRKGKRHVLTERMTEGHALSWAKLHRERVRCVVVGWRGNGGGIRAFMPSDELFSSWRESIIDDGGMACEDLCLADLDSDVDFDIIACGRATKNVKIYWNETDAKKN